MKKLQAAVAAVTLSAASSVLASGDSGTAGVGEMTLTGAQFGMLVGALVGLGVVVWVVVKIASK
jgi:lysophospholipase L1-like esterase